MADDKEVDVIVDDEPVDKEEVITKVDGDKADTDKKADDVKIDGDIASQLNELKAQAAKDREDRLAAERRYRAALDERNRATQYAQTARTDLAEREAQSIEAGIAAAQSEAQAGETEYKAAFEAGDAAAMAVAQRKMARAEAKSVRLDEAKADLEAAAARKTQTRSEEQRPDASDPVEAYIAGRTEPTANWLREHKEFITDARKNAKLTAAHFSAVGDGLSPDTPTYFEHVETFLGLRQTMQEKSNGQARPTKRPSVPAAPVQASGGGTGGSSGNEVRLSKSEALAATDGTHVYNYDDPSPQKRFKKGDPIGVQEFARRKLAMTKQGLYDKTYVQAVRRFSVMTDQMNIDPETEPKKIDGRTKEGRAAKTRYAADQAAAEQIADRGREIDMLLAPAKAAARTTTNTETRTLARGEVLGRNGEVLSRTRTGSGDIFKITEDMIPAGWEYQWNAISVVGNTEILQDQNLMMAENGWRPVPADRYPGRYGPKGYKGNIVRGSQLLMERPKRLCDAARAEDLYAAKQLISDRNESLKLQAVNKNMADGFEMGGRYRGTGGNIRMSIDPALDVPKPSYKTADEG